MKQLIQLQAHFSTLLSSPTQTAVFVSPMEKDEQCCAHPSADYKTWQRKLKTQQWDHMRKACLFKAWCGLYTGLETAGLYFLLFLNLSLLLHSEKSAGNTGIAQRHCTPNNTASTLPRPTMCKPKCLITRYFLKANLCHQSDPRLAFPSAFPT